MASEDKIYENGEWATIQEPVKEDDIREDGEWTVIRQPEKGLEGFTKPGFRARVVEDLSMETIQGDIVAVEKYMDSDDSGFGFQYIPMEVFEDIGTHLVAQKGKERSQLSD